MTTTVCVMGELLAEFLSRNPHQKFIQPGEFIGPFPGGAPAIFAAQAAKLSHRTTFFRYVGNDDFARLIVGRLRHEGVITDGIHIMDNAVTGTASVNYQNPQQRGFVFNIPDSAYGLFTAEHVDKDLLRQCNHLHIADSSLFSFRMIDAVRKTITTIKPTGGTVSFDPNIRKEMLGTPEIAQVLDYLIEYAGIFIPSESELPFFVRHKNLSEEQTVNGLLHDDIEHVAIKHARHGASYYKLKNGTLHAQHVVGHDIEIVDPAGVGNCSGATFIILFLSGFPVHKALQCANASGAPAVMRQGLIGGVSSLADIEDSLQQH